MQMTPRNRGGWLRAREQLETGYGTRRAATPQYRRLESGLRAAILAVRAWLSERTAAVVIVGFAMLACAPAMSAGFFMDDYFHAVVFRGDLHAAGSERAAWDGFSFAKSPEITRQLVDEGVFPWWSDPEAKVSFFRPLTSLSLWVDHNLWPHAPGLMHLHSIVWYGLLLLVVASVYRRFAATSFSVGFAGLALLIYAFDDARVLTVGWLANRGALMALTFGFAALLAHDSWRVRGRTRDCVRALALFAIGLLCAEAAVQAVGYLLAYAIFLDPGTKRQRLRSLVPYVALIAVWRASVVALGIVVVGSEQYIDPVRRPLDFVLGAAQHLPVLLASQFVGLSADLGDLLRFVEPQAAAFILPAALFGLAICLWVVAPLWTARREVRFWSLGTLLATVPVCATAPSDRLLLATGLGGAALVSIVIWAAFDRVREVRSRLRVYAVVALAVVNIVIGPLLLPLEAYALSGYDDYLRRADESLPHVPDLANKTLVFVNMPSDEYGIYLGQHRLVNGGAMPKRWRWLANSNTDLLVTRSGARSLTVRPTLGFLAPGSHWSLRSRDFRSRVGDTVELDGVTLTTSEVTADGRPAEVVATFDESLDSGDFLWLRWGGKAGFVPFTLPAVGAGPVLVPANQELDW